MANYAPDGAASPAALLEEDVAASPAAQLGEDVGGRGPPATAVCDADVLIFAMRSR